MSESDVMGEPGDHGPDDPADASRSLPEAVGSDQAHAAPCAPIVGVGASAGGLDAFSRLLRGMPAEPGLALVLVQHLAPHHASSLAELLRLETSLPVVELTAADTPVERNHVYVIAPNRSLIWRDGQLRLLPRASDRSQFTPIDLFLQSLARDLQSDAIGVILSGAGSDGVEGVHAIKAAGGSILVQAPETASQPSMPQAALATGKVDLVLPPEEMGAELVRLARRRPVRSLQLRGPGEALELSPEQLQQIFSLLRIHSGVDFRQYKLPTVLRRIQRRMALHGVDTVEHYVKFLEEHASEVARLYQELLIQVTRFFREPESFVVLAEQVFPELLDEPSHGQPLRIWTPACSTGEETYSAAIVLCECLEQRPERPAPQIFATDLSEVAVERARCGTYPASIAEDVSSERLNRFFQEVDGRYQIRKKVRELCIFARQDLTRDPPFSRLDLIMCRNVMIYLGQQAQSRLINVFHYALRAGGYLILGSAESIGMHADLFQVVDKKHRVFRKAVAPPQPQLSFAASYVPYANRPLGRPMEPSPRTSGTQRAADRLLLSRFAPPGVVVDQDLRIVEFRGQTGKFLEPAPGDASFHLFKMCREGLLPAMRSAVHAARQEGRFQRRDGLRLISAGESIEAAVEVIPLKTTDSEPYWLILFYEGPAAGSASATGAPVPERRVPPTPDEAAEEIERLHMEIVANQEFLEATIQDLEAANEELQSANEEILSSNEELQSTNEELDTAKEELQSTNEELATVNDELHGRNDELARINNDLTNLLHGIQVAVVIVSSDLRIRRFTPMAERLLNMIPGDLGRPLGQIKPNIECGDLEALIRQVIETVCPEQREVCDNQGRHYLLTIRPYKDADSRIDGAVLLLQDVDELRRHEQRALRAERYAEAVYQSVREPLVVLDGELRIEAANSAFLHTFQLTGPHAVGKLFYELDRHAWDVPALRRALEEVLPHERAFDDVTIETDFPRIGRRCVRLNGRSVVAEPGERATRILLAMEVQDASPAAGPRVPSS